MWEKERNQDLYLQTWKMAVLFSEKDFRTNRLRKGEHHLHFGPVHYEMLGQSPCGVTEKAVGW